MAARVADRPELRTYAVGGKRLRARLALLPSRVQGAADADRAIRYAAFVELIHAATLCHDDVVDRSDRRRGDATLAATAGARGATMAGLLLMWRAYGLVGGESTAVREAVGRAARRVAEGQADETASLWLEVPIDVYLERQRQKTGALFELAAWLGAHAVDLPARDTKAYCRFAMHLGLGFQVADDLRDFAGAEDLGREPGADLREGVLTLPVLLALRHDAARARLQVALRRLRESGDAMGVARCRRIVVDAGCLSHAEEVAEDLWDTARSAASEIGATAVRRAAHDFARAVRDALTWTGLPRRSAGSS